MATQLIERNGLRRGTPDIRSVGAIDFSPEGILFVADNTGGRIFAIAVEDPAEGEVRSLAIDSLDVRLAGLLGCQVEDLDIRDLAVHPLSGAVYFSVMRGAGDNAVPILVRAGQDGSLVELELADSGYSEVAIPDAPDPDDSRQVIRVAQSVEPAEEIDIHGIKLRLVRDPMRAVTVTDLAFAGGTVLVAGASNEEFVSRLRRIPFPFGDPGVANSLEIFHVSHGKYETEAPVRTLVPFAGGHSVLASYTCTPVVHFSLDDAADGALLKGRTVAELGSMNTPLDMVAYESGGREYVLVANSRHPLFKLASADIDSQPGLTEPREPVGVPRTDLPHEGVRRLAVRGGDVLMLQRDEAGHQHLRSYAAAEL